MRDGRRRESVKRLESRVLPIQWLFQVCLKSRFVLAIPFRFRFWIESGYGRVNNDYVAGFSFPIEVLQAFISFLNERAILWNNRWFCFSWLVVRLFVVCLVSYTADFAYWFSNLILAFYFWASHWMGTTPRHGPRSLTLQPFERIFFFPTWSILGDR